MSKLRQSRFNLTKHKLYIAWSSMHDRCYNLKSQSYLDYGGRGILVAFIWHKDNPEGLKNFIEWSESHDCYKLDDKGHRYQIDRIDNDLGYSPENCRYVSCQENLLNKRSSKFSILDGEKLNDSVASLRLGHYKNYITDIRRGHSVNSYPDRLVVLGECKPTVKKRRYCLVDGVMLNDSAASLLLGKGRNYIAQIRNGKCINRFEERLVIIS